MSQVYVRPLLRRVGAKLTLALLLGIFLFTGAIGLDFGDHWDEPLALQTISQPIETGIFLPGTYNYPSIVFDIGTLALAPETVPFLCEVIRRTDVRFAYLKSYQEVAPKAVAFRIVEFIHSPRFLFRLRAIFLTLTALSGIWLYAAVRACKRNEWEAVFAAAILLTSWEVAYHARWVAPDTILMQFASLWLMLFAFALHSRSHALRWLRLTAAAAALACGSKYQGGVLLLPVLVYTFLVVKANASEHTVVILTKEILYLLVIFGIVFLFSTPGALLQPAVFANSVRSITHQYTTGHGGHTLSVRGHVCLLFIYFTCVFASHWPLAAGIFFFVGLWGAIIMVRENGRGAALLLCAPAAFLLWVIQYHVMFVRNYLLIVPFVGLFCAHGAFRLWESRAKTPWVARALIALFVAILMLNTWFLFHTAFMIHDRQSTPYAADIVAYLRKHSDALYFASPQVTNVAGLDKEKLKNLTSDPAAAQRYILFTTDVPPLEYPRWSANWLGQYHIVSGPLAVNFDYYSEWHGAPLVVELSMKRAREMQLTPNL